MKFFVEKEEVIGEIICGEGTWGDDGCVEVDGCEVEGKFCWMKARGSENTSCEMKVSQDISCFSSWYRKIILIRE